jgi:hypothetical protein
MLCTLLNRGGISNFSVTPGDRDSLSNNGVEVPTSVKHSAELDETNGNHFWRDALTKEMHNVGIAFSVLDEGQNAPVGWSLQSGHIIYDVKMDFTRKAR